MLHPKLIQPSSIAVIGASDNLHSPGGKVLYNLISHDYQGKLFGVNPKNDFVQGIPCYRDVEELPNNIEVAIIAVAARYCVDIVKVLAEKKNTKGFILYSAGFSELNEQGAKWEKQIAEIVSNNGGTLLGPNNIGMMNTHYTGVFTTPVPELKVGGVDFISGSGATAVFIIEAALQQGLSFHSVFTVGNSAQTGVEEVLAYLDENYEEGISSKVIILYMESIHKPGKLLSHARSLYKKGVRIAAIKAGRSEAGSRAASSHTGALASPDVVVDAILHKAGIIRCFSREDLIQTAIVLSYPSLPGNNMGIITHAGGPAVMLTDALSEGGMEIPTIQSPEKDDLLKELFPGSSVANPIDFLATGTAEQLNLILEYSEKYFQELDALAVIFGSPGLFSVREVYEVLAHHIKKSVKPIFPILPSVVNASGEIREFISWGYPVFFDEVVFAKALSRVYHNRIFEQYNFIPEKEKVKEFTEILPKGYTGYLDMDTVRSILEKVGIPLVRERIISRKDKLEEISRDFDFPVVMKVVGPLHKTELNGVRIGVEQEEINAVFEELMDIPGVEAISIQELVHGMELFAGIKYEPGFGHHLVFGKGGTEVEVWKDIRMSLLPAGREEIQYLTGQLQIYPLMKGHRGKSGVNIDKWTDILMRLSSLVAYIPQIEEMDLNPLIASGDTFAVVDARIKISEERNH